MRLKNTDVPAMLTVVVIASTALFSCKKEVSSVMPKESAAIFPTTEKDNQTVSILKEVGSILKEVYKDPKAYREVNATIYSGYYEDERVLLKDLLFPESSPLYKTESFKKYESPIGIFKQRFLEELDKGKYTVLNQAIPSQKVNARLSSISPTDTTAEIFSNSNGVAIYFPYSENFGTSFTAEYFDNINTDPWGEMATIISADREADSAPGSEPYRKKTYDETGEIIWIIEYRPVTVNDDYAEVKTSHIVNVGAEPARMNPADPPPATNVNRVFHGWSTLYKKQLDAFISFTGNGGGSEMKIARISGYLQFQDQQVSNFTGDVFSCNYTRKDIRKGRWKRVYGVWDPNWITDNFEQTYAVWEEDTKGTKTFTGSLSTTVKIDSSATATGTIGFSVQVQTQDELVTQRKITRSSYFGTAKSDQGWSFQMCDDKGCRYDDTFLPSGQYWPIYDGGTIWRYTWPYNSY